MADPVLQLTPDWVTDGFQSLLEQYAAAIKLELAYQEFIENYENPDFPGREGRGSFQDVIANRWPQGAAANDAGGAGGQAGIINVAQAINALEQSQWLQQQTVWKRFGLITGFNVNSIVPATVQDPGQASDWPKVRNFLKFDSTEPYVSVDELKQVADPVYITEVQGSVEANGDVMGNPTADTVTRALGIWPQGRYYSDEFDEGYGPMIATDFQTKISDNRGHFTSLEYIEYLYLNPTALPGALGGLVSFRGVLEQKAKAIFPSHAAGQGASEFNAKFSNPNAISIWNHFKPVANPYPRNQTFVDERFLGDNFAQSPVEGETRFALQGSYALPDRVSVWPTLPLYDFSEDAKEDAAAGYLARPGINIPARLPNAVPADSKQLIADAWMELFGEFQSPPGMPAGGALQAFDSALRESLFGNNRSLLFGGPPDSQNYRDGINDQIERILDAFDAGEIETEVEGQGIGTGSGTAEATLDQVKDEVREEIIGFRNLTPFDFQCFLVENIGKLSEYQESFSSYNNIIRVSAPPNAGPAATISQINMGGNAGACKELLNLPAAVYGLLVPYIKIYRVDYTQDGMIPWRQVEMPIPNFVDPNDIQQLFGRGSGRYGGWGLQSFTWSLDGVQPAEVDNNISATLSFYFQSINDLFQGSSAAGQEVPNPLDLLISAATLKKIQGERERGEDPTKKPPKECGSILKDNINQAYEGAQFRIKVVAGWATPPKAALRTVLPDKDGDEIDNVVSAIESTRISLYLQQTRHNLDFKQDGSILLSIDYQAALSGILTSNKLDILGTNDKDAKAQLKQLEDAVKGTEKALEEELAEDTEFGRDSATNLDIPPLQEKLKALLEKKMDLLNQDRLKKYKKFLSLLYGRRSDGEQLKDVSPKIYTIEVSPKEIYGRPLWKIKDPIERRERALTRMSESAAGRGFRIRNQSSFAGGAPQNTDLLEILAGQEGDGATATNSAEALRQQWTEAMGDAKAGDMILIPYFYLGDLIDTIIQNNDSVGSAGHPATGPVSSYLTFLASIELTNPLMYYQLENTPDVECADTIDDVELLRQLRARGDLAVPQGVRSTINIGSIPVSLDQFNIWFKNNVIENQRNSYYLLHFLKDICSQLISDSLRGACFGKNTLNDIRFDTSVLHFFNKKRSGGKVLKEPRLRPKVQDETGTVRQRIASTQDVALAVGAATPMNDIPGPDVEPEDWGDYDASTGVILYSTDAKPRSRTGQYDADLNVGIFHHYIGSSAGLVKSISFSRVDQEYLREAKIQKYGNLGAQQLRELYSATIEMVGNTLFKNGQYTFIWPTLISSDDYYARLLGLGGYFLITGVSHTISPSGYDVTVSALQEGLAFKDRPAAPATAVPLPGLEDIEAPGEVQDDPTADQVGFTEGYDPADVDDGSQDFEDQMRARWAERYGSSEEADNTAAAAGGDDDAVAPPTQERLNEFAEQLRQHQARRRTGTTITEPPTDR